MYSGDYLRASKEKQQKEYAEELKQQIMDKKRLTHSPLPFSTTSNDTFSFQSQFQYPSKRILNTKMDSPFALIPGTPLNSDKKNSSLSNTYGGYSKKEVIPDFGRTSVAPLNLNITTFTMDTLPSLPRQIPHSNNININIFPERIRSINQQYIIQRQQSSKINENYEKIKQLTFILTNEKIKEIELILEKSIGSKLPNLISPLNSNLTKNRTLLDTNSSKIINQFQFIKDSLIEKNTLTNQFLSKQIDISDSTKTFSLEVKNDFGRIHDIIDQSIQKIIKIENKSSNLLNNLSYSNSEFDTIDTNITNIFSSLQKESNELINNLSIQLSQDIKKENELNKTVTLTLQTQIEEINQKYSSIINQLQDLIKEITLSFSNTSNELSNSINEGIEETQVQTEQYTSEISNRIDHLINDTENNFNNIQNELIITIKDMKNNQSQIRNTLENSINQEYLTKQKNNKLFFDKFSHLNNIFQKEIQIQKNKINELNNNIEINGSEYIKKNINPINTDILFIKSKITDIDKLELDVEKLELFFLNTKNQIYEGVTSLQRTFQEITNSYNNLNNNITNSFSLISESLFKLENNKYDQFIIKEDLIRSNEKIENIFNDKIKLLENQISIIYSNISNLEFGESLNFNFNKPLNNILQIEKNSSIIDLKNNSLTESSQKIENVEL